MDPMGKMMRKEGGRSWLFLLLEEKLVGNIVLMFFLDANDVVFMFQFFFWKDDSLLF